MTWRPIMMDMEGRVWESIRAISDGLGTPPEGGGNASLQSGYAGVALFHHYLDQCQNVEREVAVAWLDMAIDAVASQPMHPSYFGGFPGIAWTAEIVQPNPAQDGEDANEDIDALIIAMLDRGPWIADYDLILGLVGLGVYAVSRLQYLSGVHCLERVLERLDWMKEPTSKGCTWRTTAQMAYSGELTPHDHYNLGVAHGVPGILGLLSHAHLTGVQTRLTETLLRGGVDWLLGQRAGSDGPSGFGYYALPDHEPSPAGARPLGWCYGDLGVSTILLLASRALGDPMLERQSIDMARALTERPIDGPQHLEPGLCHGAAGVGHIFNRLYQYTGEEEFRSAARKWFLHLLALCETAHKEGGVINSSRNHPDGTREWVPDSGLLSGATGTGLALLASISDVPPKWDQFMLLSSPYCGQ